MARRPKFVNKELEYWMFPADTSLSQPSSSMLRCGSDASSQKTNQSRRFSTASKREVVIDLHVTDNSLWATRLEDNEKRSSVMTPNESCATQYDLHVTDHSLWRTHQFQENTADSDGSCCFSVEQLEPQVSSEVTECQQAEVVSEKPQTKNNLLRKFGLKSPTRIRKSFYQFRPSMAPAPKFNVPLCRDVSKRKSSVESTKKVTRNATQKIPMFSPRLLDRVRLREMYNAVNQAYASPTIASLNKSVTNDNLPSPSCNNDESREITEEELEEERSMAPNTSKSRKSSRSSLANSTELSMTSATPNKVNRKRTRLVPGRPSALQMIAVNYNTPSRNEPRLSASTLLMSPNQTAPMSGPIQSQAMPLNSNMSPRVLFEDSGSVPLSQEILSQPVAEVIRCGPPLALLNDSDLTVGTDSPLRCMGNIPSESRFVDNAQFLHEIDPEEQENAVELSANPFDFDSTKVLPFAQGDEDFGLSRLSLNDDPTQSPAPKHLIIAAKKTKAKRVAEIKPPKIVNGTDKYAADHPELRRSSRARFDRRLNTAAGERPIYSPKGSLVGVSKGHFYYPICLKHNVVDVGKAIDEDRRIKNDRAVRRKTNREAREQRLANADQLDQTS